MLRSRLCLQVLNSALPGCRASSTAAWTPTSQRTGALALKVGMVPIWDHWGERHAVTVLQLDSCQVVQVKTDEVEGYTSLQVGAGEAKEKNVDRAMTHHYKKHGVAPKRKLQEFRVSPDAVLPVGTALTAAHFVPGQVVDITGISKGKGFQGVMKRHGFAGGSASHGNSKAHRVMGSTGMCQDPGRVFKGKKMPGRMGGTKQTIAGLSVYKVELDRNLIYVKGAVPGPPGKFVAIKDSRKQVWDEEAPPPFPTASEAEVEAATAVSWVGKDGEEKVRQELVDGSGSDPNDYENVVQPFKGFN